MKNKYLTILLTATAFSLAGYQGGLRAEEPLTAKGSVVSEPSLSPEKKTSPHGEEPHGYVRDHDRMKDCCGTSHHNQRFRNFVPDGWMMLGSEEHLGYTKHTPLVQRLKQDLQDSGECDNVRLLDFPSKDGLQTILVCYEKSGSEEVVKDSINLSGLCDVRLKENNHWYSFEWLVGDDVITTTRNGNSAPHRYWDKPAAKIFADLKEYLMFKDPAGTGCGDDNNLLKKNE